ncbi:hypothetical protein OF83DRAFT_1126600 [Amylostereum chailletii]|nr:hypothetical protein OF83DRAFT_1126600 [Amylostereum chailletii]
MAVVLVDMHRIPDFRSLLRFCFSNTALTTFSLGSSTSSTCTSFPSWRSSSCCSCPAGVAPRLTCSHYILRSTPVLGIEFHPRFARVRSHMLYLVCSSALSRAIDPPMPRIPQHRVHVPGLQPTSEFVRVRKLRDRISQHRVFLEQHPPGQSPCFLICPFPPHLVASLEKARTFPLPLPSNLIPTPMGLGKLAASAAAFKVVAEAAGLSKSDEDDASHRPLLNVDTSQASSSRLAYGATAHHGERVPSPETSRRRTGSLPDVPEDAVPLADGLPEEDWEDYLEDRGLYIGSYRRLTLWYALVPLSSLLLWIVLVFPPTRVWHTPAPDSHPALPTPIPELLAATALWSLSHLLSVPLYTLATALLPSTPAQVLHTALTVLLRTLLRIAALPILGVQHHLARGAPTFRAPAFARVWWIALGWSLAEVSVGVAQGYDQLALYRDVLVSPARARELVALWTRPRRTSKSRGSRDGSGGSIGGSGGGGRMQLARMPSEAEIRLEVDRDLDQLVALKTREELEELYGVPVVRIPVFIACLLRIASIVLSLGFTLVLSAAYLSAPLAHPRKTARAAMPLTDTNGPLALAFALVYAAHLALALLHTPMLLPRLGVHVVAYVGFLVGLGSVFAGLGMWGALS